MAALTHCFHVLGIVTLHRLTSATVLPQMRHRQHHYPRVATLAIMTKTKSKLPIQCRAAVALCFALCAWRLMVRSTLANTFTPPLGAIATYRQRELFPIGRIVCRVHGHRSSSRREGTDHHHVFANRSAGRQKFKRQREPMLV